MISPITKKKNDDDILLLYSFSPYSWLKFNRGVIYGEFLSFYSYSSSPCRTRRSTSWKAIEQTQRRAHSSSFWRTCRCWQLHYWSPTQTMLTSSWSSARQSPRLSRAGSPLRPRDTCLVGTRNLARVVGSCRSSSMAKDPSCISVNSPPNQGKGITSFMQDHRT